MPIDRVRRVTVVSHGLGTLEGALIGTAIGVGLGALYGLGRAAEWGALIYGVVGLVSGTLVGAVIGHHDVLELR